MRRTAIIVALLGATAGPGLAQPAGETAAGPDQLDALDDLDQLDALAELDAATGTGTGVSLRTFEGYLVQELRGYVLDRAADKQRVQAITELRLDVEVDLGARLRLVATPRLLIDALDPHLYRYQPIEAFVSYAAGRLDLRAGLLVDNLGIVDAFNPIDVINRRDLATDMVDPERVGELGVRARYRLPGAGAIGEPTLTGYLLPVWQPTAFPTDDNRFSLTQGNVRFADELTDEPNGGDRVWTGVRVEHTLTTSLVNADVQYLVARGPERIPGFEMRPGESGADLVPVYYGTYVAGGGVRAVPNPAWWSGFTLKGEVAYKRPYSLAAGMTAPDDYLQYAVGVDRTLERPFGRKDRLSVMVEYLGEAGASDPMAQLRPFEHDLALRLFWQAGDFARTALEARGIVDVVTGETVGEASVQRQLRVIHDDLQGELAVQLFHVDRDEPGLYGMFPNNSNLRMRLRFDF